MSHTERAKYLTDLTDEQWQIIRALLPPPSRRGAPQKICRRAIIDAIIYVVRSSCPWRLFPREFPNWKTVYGIFFRWRNDGTWQKIHDTLRDMLRRKVGRKTSAKVRRLSTVKQPRRRRSAESGVTMPAKRLLVASSISSSIRWV